MSRLFSGRHIAPPSDADLENAAAAMKPLVICNAAVDGRCPPMFRCAPHVKGEYCRERRCFLAEIEPVKCIPVEEESDERR